MILKWKIQEYVNVVVEITQEYSQHRVWKLIINDENSSKGRRDSKRFS